jgi:flagellar protein FliL
MTENQAAAAAPKKKSKKLLIIVIAAVLLIGGGVGGFLMLSAGDAAAGEAKPEPGAVVTVEPITINLAEGHYLKLGFALQATADAAHEPEPAIALDLAIAQYTDMKVAELSTAKGREQAKEDLLHKIKEAYHDEVMDIYFTQFVTQ